MEPQQTDISWRRTPLSYLSNGRIRTLHFLSLVLKMTVTGTRKGPIENVRETGSVLCRIALWDCLGEEF